MKIMELQTERSDQLILVTPVGRWRAGILRVRRRLCFQPE